MLKAMIIQGVTPFLMVLPVGISLLMQTVYGSAPSQLRTRRLPVLGYPTLHFVYLLSYLNPFFDAMTTLFVVKAYKNAVKKLLFSCGGRNEVRPQNQIIEMTLHHEERLNRQYRQSNLVTVA